jgi:hypothetical protein
MTAAVGDSTLHVSAALVDCGRRLSTLIRFTGTGNQRQIVASAACLNIATTSGNASNQLVLQPQIVIFSADSRTGR